MKINFNGLKFIIILFLIVLVTSCKTDYNNKTEEEGKEVTLLLEPRPGNPKNFSGDFIRLKDGRILYLYAYGVGDVVADDAPGCTVARYSSDDGKTWTSDDIVQHIEGGLSLLRLPDARIALFYLRAKNFGKELYPYMIISDDETKTWSAPVKCVDESGYYTINNDRIVQLKNGRIIVPVAFYSSGESSENNGLYSYYSNDIGETWHRSERVPNPNNIELQEPGVVELKSGDLMMFIRTNSGVQYLSYSKDKGEHWSAVQPSNIRSPLSPASIKRIPSTGDLLLVWNDNYDPQHRDGGNRSPLSMAISKDEGKTWEKKKTIESDPYGWYCYTAIQFFGDHILLGHSTGNTNEYIGLACTQVTRLSLDWIYSDATSTPTIKTNSNGIVELNCSDKEANIYYSLDRKMPNILYDKPITISHTIPLWVQAIVKGKTNSDLITTYVGMNILQPSSEALGSIRQGLAYEYHEGVVSTVENIESLDVKAKGVVGTFNINNRQRDINFAFTFKGYIKIPKNGKYTFYLASNDGSALYLDGYELINHDGAHAITENSAEVALTEGKHKIVVKYFQLMGGLGLKLYWQGPAFAKQIIPDSVLYNGDQGFHDSILWLEKEAHRIIRKSMRTMNDGTSVFPPQVGIGYEAFWLRDYSYTLEGSVNSYSDKELIDACMLFIRSMRMDGASVDCIKFDSTPIYKPGFGSMGKNPVADGSQFTINVAWQTYQRTKDSKFLKTIIDALVKTMKAVPLNPNTHLVHIIPGNEQDRCPYGFTDTINKQGDVLFCSLLYVQSSKRLSELLNVVGRTNDAEAWKNESELVAKNIREIFWDSKSGLFQAATLRCKEHDIWGSAFAVYLGVAKKEQQISIATYFKKNYEQIVQNGQIRHLPGGVYWEQANCEQDTYQNGAYWATPTGWFVYTLDHVDSVLANQTVIDMVNDFKKNGANEWIFNKKYQLPNYLASASLPLAGINSMVERRKIRRSITAK